METLPTDSRQPPDGHEFPDYNETNSETIYKNYDISLNKETNIKKNLNNQQSIKTYKSIEYINLCQNNSSLNSSSEFTINKPCTINKTNSISSNDLNSIYNINDKFNSKDDITFGRTEVEVTLHTRSQSLIDMSRLSKQKNDRWNLLAEQRRKGLSKLKGLVIPENLNENEPYATTPVNLPEIVSQTKSSLILDKIDNNLKQQKEIYSKDINQITLPLTKPPWDINSNNIPKYSPAFKRKSLQVYPSIDSGKYRGEKTANTKEIIDKKLLNNKSETISNNNNRKENLVTPIVDLRKCEGESDDDDSGASSNQSSYLSKYSPPPSPNSSTCDIIDYQSNTDERYNLLNGRLLRPSSVEAINRKNILASAKCRSGRDLKVGSPVIHRKSKENDNNSANIYNSSKHDHHNEKQSTESISNNNNNTNNKIELVTENETIIKEKAQDLKKNLSIEKLNSSIENKIKDKKMKDLLITQNTTKSFYRSSQSVKPLSVSNLRKSFEKVDSTIPMPLVNNSRIIKKKCDEKIDIKTKFNNENSVQKQIKKREDTSVKENRNKIENNSTNENNLENKSNNENIKIRNGLNTKTVVLCPKTQGENIGISLIGGVDCDLKDIIVHRIRYGSVAYENGNLKKGDRILSINGKSTKDLTYVESLEMLKKPLSKFVLIVEESYEENIQQSPRRKTFNTTKNSENDSLSEEKLPLKNITHTISLIKEGNIGLGFSIEGGKDSLQGDVPLRIKKIFTGGAADKNGELNVGDELLAINDKSFNNLSKIEAWTLMKKLPDGNVKIQIHR